MTSTNSIFGDIKETGAVSETDSTLEAASPTTLVLLFAVTDVEESSDVLLLAVAFSELNVSLLFSLAAAPFEVLCANDGLRLAVSLALASGAGDMLRLIAVGEKPIDDFRSPISLRLLVVPAVTLASSIETMGEIVPL